MTNEEKCELQVGKGIDIIADKCDVDYRGILLCPNPVTCADFHYGQFGHRVLFLYCEECYAKSWVVKERAESDAILAAKYPEEATNGFTRFENEPIPKWESLLKDFKDDTIGETK